MIESIKSTLPESPEEKLKKMIKRFKIDEKNASILTKNIDVALFFEKIVEKVDPKFALSWVTIELLRFLNYNKTTLDKVEINPEHFIALLKLVKEGKITELQGKQLLNQFYPKSFNPINIEGKITDKKELEEIARRAIKQNSKAVQDYNAGEQKALDFLMGEIMKITNRRADYKIAREVLQNLLKENKKR